MELQSANHLSEIWGGEGIEGPQCLPRSPKAWSHRLKCVAFFFLCNQRQRPENGKTKKGGGARKVVERCELGSVDSDMGISIIRGAMSRRRVMHLHVPAVCMCICYLIPESGRMGVCVCVVRDCV